MTLSDYTEFCESLPGAYIAVQWKGASVAKVGPKMFAIARQEPNGLHVTFKATDMGYDIMRDMPGLRPAPYLASRGMKWIQHHDAPGLDDAALREHICASYDMVVAKLTRAQREVIFGQAGETR